MRIYITHCSAKKDLSLRSAGAKVFPDKLYTATPTQRFMMTCKEKNVQWAIFSDKYGVWFPSVEREWYEKDPDSVTHSEFMDLVRSFDSALASYHEICFYHNPGRFHPLYCRLIKTSRLSEKVSLFSHLRDIRLGCDVGWFRGPEDSMSLEAGFLFIFSVLFIHRRCLLVG
jgi:hypothetical protein